ncbi:39056_t:CDS:2 [Gigaspora margarita]|uniref:39056_t:CDS:1 n=1 Tax=Gigaspora margarita TaxID=4874 RepID=A0ABN7VXF6_GIGMA|nr:39056_t:CDS:2 [Gigaspora margarita]
MTYFIGQLKEQEEEIVKNKKKVKTIHNQIAIENQQSIQNALETMDTQKNNQNSKNSLLLPKSKMKSALQLETNTQPNEEVLSQTITTMLDKIRKVKEVEVNNKQHMTGDIEIDRFDDTQFGIEEEIVANSREGQMLYSEAVKKLLPQT